MKSIIALTATLALAITFTLTACGKGSEKDKYAGIYEYAYPYGSEENAYIVLSEENGKVTGFYYGTSDEFDEAREGYYAEYFVAPMTNLKINGDTITFELKVKESDFLTKLIDLKITSTQEAIKAGNENGQGPIRIDHKNMVGYISADKKTILIKGDKEEGYRDDREFVKTETINRTEPPPPVEHTVDPLYMAIHQAILAFMFKDEQRLNIIKDFGVAYVNAPGIYKTFSLSDKVPFGAELNGDIGYNEISDSYYINYEAFPTFSCEEEKWNKSGVYLDTTYFAGTLAGIAKQNNEIGISDWSAKEIKKFEELGKSSREIFIADTEGNALNFILTLWEGEWYLTAVIEVDPCGA
jgi:hypothetical protein